MALGSGPALTQDDRIWTPSTSRRLQKTLFPNKAVSPGQGGTHTQFWGPPLRQLHSPGSELRITGQGCVCHTDEAGNVHACGGT